MRKTNIKTTRDHGKATEINKRNNLIIFNKWDNMIRQPDSDYSLSGAPRTQTLKTK